MNILTNCLTNKKNSCVPIWFMRQAGRYLPEFKKIRSQNKNFIKLCLNSELSSEITLQPIKRFNLDAAIIFSDILMVPYALGQEVSFVKDEGPILSTLNIDKLLNTTEKKFIEKLQPVYDAISKTRKKLDKEKSLIAFVGSPWTLIIYMLGLKRNKFFLDKQLLEKKKIEINLILQKLNFFLHIHIDNQIKAGADVVQIFDSWSGLIPTNDLHEYCYNPNLSLVSNCRKKGIPVICFPKGLGKNYLEFIKYVKPDCISLDYDLDPNWILENSDAMCYQGGMDPKILLLEEEKIYQEAEKYLKLFKNKAYIFNLGHGLLPETDPSKVEKLVKYVRSYGQH